MAPATTVDDRVLRRARAEYLEMPGLRLTSAPGAAALGPGPADMR